MLADDGRVTLACQTAALSSGADPAYATSAGVVGFVRSGARPSAARGRRRHARRRGPRAPAHQYWVHGEHHNASQFRLRPPEPRNMTSPVQPCDPLIGLPLGGMPAVWSPTIRDIQGRGHVAPLRWELVVDVPGIVTAVGGHGFW